MGPLLDALGATNGDDGKKLFLPLGHDRGTADRLRAIGWRTVAAVEPTDDPQQLGCSHVLDGDAPQTL